MRSVVHNIERAGIPAAVAGPYVRGDVGTIGVIWRRSGPGRPRCCPCIASWRWPHCPLASKSRRSRLHKARPLANCSGRRQPVRAALLGRYPRNMSHWEVGVMTEIPLHWQTISELSRRIRPKRLG